MKSKITKLNSKHDYEVWFYDQMNLVRGYDLINLIEKQLEHGFDADGITIRIKRVKLGKSVWD